MVATVSDARLATAKKKLPAKADKDLATRFILRSFFSHLTMTDCEQPSDSPQDFLAIAHRNHSAAVLASAHGEYLLIRSSNGGWLLQPHPIGMQFQPLRPTYPVKANGEEEIDDFIGN